MRTGDCSIITGIYRSLCGCGVESEIRRGDRVPSCPKCRQDTGWTLRPRPNGVGTVSLAATADLPGDLAAVRGRHGRRRRLERVARCLIVECVGRDGARAVGHTVDISASGVLIEVDPENLTIPKALHSIGPVTAQALAAFSSGMEICFRQDGVTARADIVRCAPSVSNSGRVRIGCQFKPILDARSRKRLSLNPRGGDGSEPGTTG